MRPLAGVRLRARARSLGAEIVRGRWGRGTSRGLRPRRPRRDSSEAARGESTGVRTIRFVARVVEAGRVKEREEDLRHLAEVLVAEAGEDEGAGLRFGERGDGGAEGPGAGGVVGDVEEEIGRREFEAAGPGGGGDADFDGGERYRVPGARRQIFRFEVGGGEFVTCLVAYWVGRGRFVTDVVT